MSAKYVCKSDGTKARLCLRTDYSSIPTLGISSVKHSKDDK